MRAKKERKKRIQCTRRRHSVTCSRRVLFGSFGRSGSLPDSNVIISYYRNFGSVDWIARPFGTTENQISHRRIVCPVDRWIRVERNLKTLRPFRPPKRDDYPVYKGAIFGILSLCMNVTNFGGYPKNLWWL